MGRYIDADYVNAFPIRIDHYDEEHGNRHFVLGIESVMEYIEEAPSIDIVFCKECKHAHMTYGGDCKYCDMWKDDDDFCIELYLDGDFYCAYGERKESE